MLINKPLKVFFLCLLLSLFAFDDSSFAVEDLVEYMGETEGAFDSIDRYPAPLGTIISSLADPKSFAKMVGDAGDFNPKMDRWVPADDRDISGSELHYLLGKERAPRVKGVKAKNAPLFYYIRINN